MSLPTVTRFACLHPAHQRRATSSSEQTYSLSQNLDDHSLLPLAVPLAIKHALPRTEIQLAGRDRHDHLVPDRQAAQVRRRVVLPGFIMAIPRRIPRGDGPLEPLQDVFPESGLMVIHENRRRDVHGTNQHETFTHLANRDFLHNLVSYVDDLLSPLRVEPEVVSPRLHESPRVELSQAERIPKL